MGNIDNKHILIFGAGGQLGKEFQYLYEEEKFPGRYTFLIKEQADITNHELVRTAIQENEPDVVINCAAYTAVDKAESEPDRAQLINVDAPHNMARICNALNLPFFHFSTDYVFPGDQERPLKETDSLGPTGVYGQTKLDGEKAVMNAHPNSIILRTSWVYSMFGHNFVRTMLRLSKDRDELNVVSDQIGSPTWARDLARAVLTIINETDNLNDVSGIYHYSNAGQCSWCEFAQEIFRIASIKMKVNPIPTTAYPTPAKRPAYSLLDKSKFKTTFGQTIPIWQDSLTKCIQEMI